ncbi:nucleoside hydrolase [Aquimarina rubra]|uniref:Nucleoside hydrolase n=1 Tax=Aquimarina rubra TaxID=1920033 RepID=A0ABW5LMW1_9FLAO
MSAHQKLSEEQMKNLLQLPNKRNKPLRVVVDTDFDNEIDDFFALTWLLLPHENIKVEGIYAAPFSFLERLKALLRANDLIKAAPDNLTEDEQALVNKYKVQIEAIEKLGITPESLLDKGSHVAMTPEEGMESSYDKLLEFMKLFDKPEIPVLKGATHYLEDGCPVRSEAVDHFIALARSASIDDPIYIMGIACATNLASAIMIAPDIIDKVVYTWTAGYPTNVTDLQNTSFNLSQDIEASQILFSSGVPLVYIPGFYVGQQLTLSQADMEAWFKDSGPIGKVLYDRYINNPLFTWYGKDKNNLFGQIWNIWDLINIAWFIDPGSVPSHEVFSPILTEEGYWKPKKDSHLIRECYYTNYNSIFPAFAEQLRAYEEKCKK